MNLLNLLNSLNLLSFFFTLLITTTLARPTTINALFERATSNSTISTDPKCQNIPNTNLSAVNWNCHNTDTFLANWWKNNSASCEGQPFYACFANFYGHTWMTCEIGTPCIPGELNTWPNATEAYYILVAIANINQYYTNMYRAMGSASQIMNELLPDLSNSLNPPKGGTSLAYKELSNAIQGALFAIPFLPEPVPQLFVVAATMWSGANLAANTVVDQTYINFSQFSKNLAIITSENQRRIGEIFKSSIENFTSFTLHSKNGAFLYGNYVGQNTTELQFHDYFKDYLQDVLINLILRSKGIYLVVMDKFYNTPPPNQWDISTHSYWSDPNLKLFSDGHYAVWNIHQSDQPIDNNGKLSKTLFETHNPLTTPQKVFDGSWKCQNSTGSLGGGGNNFDPTHPFANSDCLYNLPVCISHSTYSYAPATRILDNCPEEFDPRKGKR